MKKYELIEESKTIFKGREVFRVKALKDFSDIKAGDIGGWVCSYNNLSQECDCWIYDDAKCLDDAKVYDNAKMFDNAIMYDNSKMFNKAKMFDNSIMCNNSVMYNNTRMLDNAIIYDNSIMYDNSRIAGNARMYDNAKMYGNSIMYDNSRMYDTSKTVGNSRMYDYAILDKDKLLCGSINKSYKKIFQYQCEKRLLTAILTEVNEILYSVGCQVGMTKEKFIDRIYNDCNVDGKGLEEYPYRQEYLDMIDIAESYLRKFI